MYSLKNFYQYDLLAETKVKTKAETEAKDIAFSHNQNLI